MYQAIVRISEKVSAISGGRLVMKPNTAGAITAATKEFDGVHEGLLDYGDSVSVYWMDKFPAAGPFTFTVGGLSPVEQWIWWQEGGGKELAERMIEGYNVKLLADACQPPEIFLWSNKPLKTVEDIDKLKIRTAGDDGTIFSRMGAAVVSMPSGEIYEGMQRGVIDAFQCSSPAVDYSIGVQEVSKYCYLSGVRQPQQLLLLMVNTERWAELPSELKMLVEEECLAEGIRYYTWMTGKDIEGLQNIKDYGTIVEPASKEIVDEMVRQAEIFYDEKAAEDPFFAEVINSQREFQKAYREAWERL